MRRLTPILAFLALSFLLVPTAPAHAQLGGWSVAVTGDVGGYIPMRQLGKNAGTIPQVPVLQVVAERNRSMGYGGGLIFTSPSGETTFRARYSSTLNGTVTGRFGVCGDEDDPLFQGALCEPVETESNIKAFGVDVGFLQGSPGDRVRASIHFGAGLRSFSFGTVACEDPTDWQVICEFTSEIWQDDGGITPFLQGGLRLVGDIGPGTAWFEVMDLVGRYGGGSDRADGNLQNDLSVTAGLAIKVF